MSRRLQRTHRLCIEDERHPNSTTLRMGLFDDFTDDDRGLLALEEGEPRH